MSDVILAKYRLELDGLRQDFDNIESQFNKNQKNIQKEANKTGKVIGQVGGYIAGAFAVDQLVSFGKQIISITGEFQKMEAVLTNTLGSNSAAKLAMNEIVQFASTTPFQVRELTDAFVKLANQGFRPTQMEMRKLGDLAASTGKSFDQLTEALIDAQVGEFERLKEFGIRASKEGENVTFTFKGVQQQVDFTNDSIRDYILSLGDLEGVQGSTAAIAETLTGQLSMLQDSFDLLMVTIGNGSSGVLVDFIKSLNEILVDTREIIQLNDGWYKSALRFVLRINPALSNFSELLDESVEKQVELNLQMENAELQANATAESYENAAEAAKDYAEFLEAIAENLSDNEEPFKTYTQQIKELKDIQQFLNEDTVGYLNLQRQINALEEKRAKGLERVNDQLRIEQELQGKQTLATQDYNYWQEKTFDALETNAPIVADLKGKQVDMDEWNATMLQRRLEAIQLETDATIQSIALVAGVLNAFGLNSKQAALVDIGIAQAKILAYASEAAAKAGAQSGAGAPVVTPAILTSVLAQSLPNVIQAYQIIRSQDVPQFYEGTELVEKGLGRPNLNAKHENYLGMVKGKPFRFNGKERILSGMDNAAIGKMSNKEVVEAVHFYKAFKGGNLFAGLKNDYDRFDKIQKKGALTVANEVKALRQDIKQTNIKQKLGWQ